MNFFDYKFADEIAPPVFYFEGKPFEQNAAGIYIPIGNTCFKSPDGTLLSTQQASAMIKPHLEAQQKGIYNSAHGFPKTLFGFPVVISPLLKPTEFAFVKTSEFKAWKTQQILADYMASQFALGAPPAYGPSPLFKFVQEFIADGLMARRRFIIDHDDSHLFIRQTLKGCAEELDEQRILEQIDGGGEWIWSEALQAHVRLA